MLPTKRYESAESSAITPTADEPIARSATDDVLDVDEDLDRSTIGRDRMTADKVDGSLESPLLLLRVLITSSWHRNYLSFYFKAFSVDICNDSINDKNIIIMMILPSRLHFGSIQSLLQFLFMSE